MMQSKGVPLFTAQQVKEIDRLAIESGTAGYDLMVQAGEAAFTVLLNQWPSVRHLLVLCGKGNNGGDGYVMAKLAHQHQLDVTLASNVPLGSLVGEAHSAAQDALAEGLNPIQFDDIPWGDLPANTVIVDALFGTGLNSDVVPPFKTLIERVNGAGLPVISVDVPSGLHATTGKILGSAIEADVTVTMIAQKQGLFTGQGPEVTGQVHLAPLAVPKAIRMGQLPQSRLVKWKTMSDLFPSRVLSSHKGHFGHVVIVGGDLGFGGAVILAALGAMKSGAGKVSVITRAQHVSALLSRCPEAMAMGAEDGQQALGLMAQADVLVVGPGLGQSAWGQQLLQQALRLDCPLVLDADALNLLAHGNMATSFEDRCVVMTPHPGEASRLIHRPVSHIQADRFEASEAIAKQWQCTVVLKGLGSIVHSEDEQQNLTSVCGDGNPGMASGGMGDVLSGICGSLLAQKRQQLPNLLHDVVTSAVCLHSAAADLAAKQGEYGLLASDVAEAVRFLMK